MGVIGLFLEPTLAMANHSCIPNAAVQFIGRNALFIAENPIRAGDEIELAYTCKEDLLSMPMTVLSLSTTTIGTYKLTIM